MTVFVDRLTLGACTAAARWKGYGRGTLVALDALPKGLRGAVVRLWASLFGWTVEGAVFLLADLRDPDGESLYRVARRSSALLALRAATQQIDRIPYLKHLSAQFDRDTLRLSLARRCWLDVEESLRRILVARALSAPAPETVRVALSRPWRFPPEILVASVPDVEVAFHGGWANALRGWGTSARGLVDLFLTALRGWRRTADPSSGRPVASVLMVEEDELDADRTSRTQPHWLFAGEPRPDFPCYVWTRDDKPLGVTSVLETLGVRCVSDRDVEGWLWQGGSGLERSLFRVAMRCLAGGCVRPTSAHAYALASVGKLAARARLAACLCRQLRVGVFLTGESHLPDANAVQLIARSAGARTVTYQYSNISFVSPSMMTTADLMLLFSPMYQRNWVWDGIRPRRFGVLGYPFDSSFGLLSERASRLRRRLEDAGARFVVCYFDESVQRDRWGQVHADDHRSDLRALARVVLETSDLAVVVKTQFVRNAPSRLYPGDSCLAAAAASGRFVEVCAGSHRNVTFPAEAAMASDIAIGHAIGGTAVLEAALAGRRSLILNPYDWRGTWDDLYRRADIVHPSLDAALSAVAEFRAGARPVLGDWSGLLHEFDPYRDGNAARRLRRFVERALAGDTESPGEAGGDGQWGPVRAEDGEAGRMVSR